MNEEIKKEIGQEEVIGKKREYKIKASVFFIALLVVLFGVYKSVDIAYEYGPWLFIISILLSVILFFKFIEYLSASLVNKSKHIAKHVPITLGSGHKRFLIIFILLFILLIILIPFIFSASS